MVGFVAVLVTSESLLTHQVVIGKSGIPAHTPHLKGRLYKSFSLIKPSFLLLLSFAINVGEVGASLLLSTDSQ